MKISYTPVGTCSREINLEVNDGIITDISVVGGCNGNLKGICALTAGAPRTSSRPSRASPATTRLRRAPTR